MDETASAMIQTMPLVGKNEQCDEALGGVQFLIIFIYINTCTINNSIGTCVQVQYSGCLDLPIVTARFIIPVFYILIQRQASRIDLEEQGRDLTCTKTKTLTPQKTPKGKVKTHKLLLHNDCGPTWDDQLENRQQPNWCG